MFQRKKFPYLVLFFESRKHIKNLEYKLKNTVDVPGFGKIKLNVRETNVSPILQLCVERNLPSAGWIGFKSRRKRSINWIWRTRRKIKRNLQIAMKNI